METVHAFDEASQLRHAAQIRECMGVLAMLLSKPFKAKKSELQAAKREFLVLLRRYKNCPRVPLTEALRTAVEEARGLQDRHSEFFHPKVTENSDLVNRLESLGDFDVYGESGNW